LWTAGKSNGHASQEIKPDDGSPEWRAQEIFSKRLLIYKKDGSIIKELGVKDLLTPEEFAASLVVFNRVHWVVEYPGFQFKLAPRNGYAFYRISPDYSVIEFHAVAPKGSKDRAGRAIRVSLTDGKIFKDGEVIEDPKKIPGRPFVGPEKLEDNSPPMREGFVPSLDPVRSAGKFTFQTPLAAAVKLELVKDGFKKLDTPTWMEKERCLVFTDLDGGKLYRLDATGSVTIVRNETCRGKSGADGIFIGLIDGKIAKWDLKGEPETLVQKADGGRELSLNDLAVSGGGMVYFSTLKDPEKGRLSMLNPATRAVTVLFDGEKELALANPNGVALAADNTFLYVGISNYKDTKKSGVYRFAIKPDGSLDFEPGKAKKFAPDASPDGIAVDKSGNVYFTAGNAVQVYSPDGKKLGSIKIPKGSGTNLCFGGEGGKTLYVTTNDALYAGRISAVNTEIPVK